jgi:alpha-galactosidase
MKLSHWGLELVADSPHVVVSLDPSGAVTTRVHNGTSAPLRPRRVRLRARLEEEAAGGYLWIHGRYMQKDALLRRFGAPRDSGYLGEHVVDGENGRRYVSCGVAALSLPRRSPEVLLVGALRLDRFFFDIELDLDEAERRARTLSLVFDLEETELPPGGDLELPAVRLAAGLDPWPLVEGWAEEVAREMRARVPDHVPTGWCSWYYFYNRVSEADIRANLEEMARSRHPAEYVQIDDGFQSATGDWLTPNERFPSGMRALADLIRGRGYKPGLWLAPLVLHEASVTLREHPELALRTREGEVYLVDTWLGRCAVLDCTHPAAEAYLRRVIRTAVRDWGYVYLKLDALAFAAVSSELARYSRGGTTGPAHLHRALEVVREEAGAETFILGCTCHFGSAIGLVDAMRVGPDVKAVWADGPRPSVRHAMRMTLQRNWMHRRWWVNDPDCLIVRDTNTQLSEAEVRFLASAIVLSGGMVVASDDLPALTPARRQLALALFPPPGRAARPLDLGAGPVPSLWRVELDGQALLGVLNWDDTAKDVEVGPGLADFWSNAPQAEVLRLEAHEGRVLRMK